MGIANVIQTATSATHHHHHHTELPKISSKTELLIGIMKSQRVKKNKKKHQLCGYLQEFCGSARIPTIVTLLGGIVVASFSLMFFILSHVYALSHHHHHHKHQFLQYHKIGINFKQSFWKILF
jgi:hypothetical protein